MTPAISYAMPAEQYHAVEAVSKSALDQFRRSPAHYQHWLSHKPEPTPAMRLGTLTHMAILEPVRFVESTAVAPLVDRRTKEGKSLWEQFQQANGGKEIITQEEREQCIGMRRAIECHPAANKLICGGDNEVSVFAPEAEFGIMCKARLDKLKTDAIVDIKTTEDASPAGFAKSVANFHYNLQAAHYTALARTMELGDLPFIFIAVEKAPPHFVAVYRLDSADIILAENERRNLLRQFSTCREFQSWPAYSREIETLTLPKWAQPKAA